MWWCMKQPLPFFDSYALADCCARIFAEWRTSKHPEQDDAKVRQMLREQAVRGLRYLWQTGDYGQRATVACRVAIWMHHPNVSTLQKAVTEREKARLA